MIPLRLDEVAAAVGGVLADVHADMPLVTGPVVADSRLVEPGALFVAVPGARVDGHAFVASAVGGGAVGVLAGRTVGVPAVVVDDPVLALGRLASWYVARLRDLVVVSITGSSGKTSTKDLLAQVLAQAGSTVAPEGSFNTEVGLPLTVLRADADTRFLVLEASARGVGHIAYLCAVAPPRVGVVLNVGHAHIGEFGSREVVAQAKGELVEALPADGLAVLNADDELVQQMRGRTRARVVFVGTRADADVRATDVRLDGRARAAFTVCAGGQRTAVRLQVAGAHQVGNALAVAAVALELGFDLERAGRALSEARPLSRWRMEVTDRPDGVTVVNDAYNANPESMRAALAALAAMTCAATPARRGWAVFGEMAELGGDALAAHRALGEQVAARRIDHLLVVGAPGSLTAAVVDAALEAGMQLAAVSRVGDAAAAVAVLQAELEPGDVVLVKASRSVGLEQVALALGAPA